MLVILDYVQHMCELGISLVMYKTINNLYYFESDEIVVHKS